VPATEDLRQPEKVKAIEAPVAWLERHFGIPAIRNGEATLQRLRAEALDRRVVHFSAHGWFEPEDPFAGSYLLLATPAGLPSRVAAARGDEAGKLTAPAVLQLGSLDGSHVSSAACISGQAREGIAGDAVGLDWAFLQRGAASILSTHWNAQASASARLCEQFYQRWLVDGSTRAAALRGSMLELMGNDRSPAALERWACFTLTGDFR
jgi:CHAT domain-containing protein